MTLEGQFNLKMRELDSRIGGGSRQLRQIVDEATPQS